MVKYGNRTKKKAEPAILNHGVQGDLQLKWN
jgi:hypothetical protein